MPKLYRAEFEYQGEPKVVEKPAFSKLSLRDWIADGYGIPKSSITITDPNKPPKAAKATKVAKNTIALQYRDHLSGGERIRVWRTDWAGDQFEILTRTQFLELEGVCKMFSIPLTEAEDD